jgi:hypothetical protein
MYDGNSAIRSRWCDTSEKIISQRVGLDLLIALPESSVRGARTTDDPKQSMFSSPKSEYETGTGLEKSVRLPLKKKSLETVTGPKPC